MQGVQAAADDIHNTHQATHVAMTNRLPGEATVGPDAVNAKDGHLSQVQFHLA